MKRYIKQIIIAVVTLLSVAPSAMAEVDITRSFYVLRNDSAANGFMEGGEWLIEFTNKDTLGYEYDYPVAMNFRGTFYPDSTFIPMQAVDSVQFVQPESVMKPGVFHLTEDHYQYIVDTDYKTTIRFRIDCISKVNLPKVGQKVISEVYKEPLPVGFLGEVESLKVSYDEGCVTMVCKQISLSDVYDRLYQTSVINETPENDSINSRLVLISKKAKLLDYDANDIVDSKGFDLALVDFGFYYDPTMKKMMPTFSPKSQNSAIRAYICDNVATAKAVAATIIDTQANTDYSEYYVSFSIKSTLNVEIDFADFVSNSFSESTGIKFTDKKLLGPPILSEAFCHKGESLADARGYVFPFGTAGDYVRIDLGLLFKANLDVSLKLSETFEVGVKLGVKCDHGETLPIIATIDSPVFPFTFSQKDFDFGLEGKFSFQTGPFVSATFSKAGVLDISAELCAGGKIDCSANTNSIGLDHIDAKESTVEDMVHKVADINESNYFKLQAGGFFDGSVKILKGHVYETSWVNWLKQFSWAKTIFEILQFDIYQQEGVPTYKHREIVNTRKAFSGNFSSKYDFSINHKLGLMLKDASLDAEDPNFVQLVELGYFDEGPVDFNYTLREEDYKHLKGIPLNVYPYMHLSTDNYCSLGKIGQMEFAYDSKISQIDGDNYTYADVEVYVDEDAYNDEDYTQSGLLVWDDNTKESDAIKIIGNENQAAYFTTQLERKDYGGENTFGDLKLYLKPWVYDNKRDRYVYGTETSYLFKCFATPATEMPTDISYNSAFLNGRIREELVKSGLEYKVGFRYHIPGESGTTVDLEYDSKEFTDISTTNKFNTLVMDLRPNTEYECLALVRVKNSILYCGEPVKFKTKNVISNLKHEAGTDFAILYADVQTDFIADECKEISFEIVESNKDFKKAIGKIADEGDFIINEDGTTTIDVIIYDLKPSVKYKYRMVFETESGYKVYSDVGYLTTEATLLKATTGSATVSGNTAKIKGTLSDDLYELLKSQGVENVYFNYIAESSDMSIEAQVKVAFSGTSYSTKLTGLNYETTYSYQFYAVDLDGNKYEGEWLKFTTGEKPAAYAEECYTLSATVNDADVTMTGGVPASTLTAIENGTLKNVQYGFEVATSSGDLTGKSPTFVTNEIDYDTGLFTITKVLQPNTTYYVRAMIFINDKWVIAKEVVSVKTANFDPGLIPPDID